jgi:hypothetical protein
MNDMKILYRPHRGSLSDAMAEMRTFDTIDGMITHVCEHHNSVFGFTMIEPDDISIGDILGDDDRIGWKDVRYVLTSRYGKEKYDYPQCIGMCSIIE